MLVICLGMQLLFDSGDEPIKTNGLGLIGGSVEIFKPSELRIPHMGWNSIEIQNNHPIINQVKLSADFYFVHSYVAKSVKNINIISTTDYIGNFPSIVCNDNQNVIGMQFHPEKSQKQGIKLIKNFTEL